MRFAALICGALAASLLVAASAQARPVLTLVSASPLEVHGAHFAPHQRVHLRFSSVSPAQIVVVRASGTGTFTITVPSGTVFDQCGGPGLTVSAAAANGTYWILLQRPPRMCAPASPDAPAAPAASSRSLPVAA
jgi:hypothetical protein